MWYAIFKCVEFIPDVAGTRVFSDGFFIKETAPLVQRRFT
jgi:hypothetical protein